MTTPPPPPRPLPGFDPEKANIKSLVQQLKVWMNIHKNHYIRQVSR
jgi:hypothetical protein